MKSAMLCLSFVLCLAACESARSSEPAPSSAAPPAATATRADVAETCADDDALLAIGGSCGGVTCGKGTWCCNASCARCVPVGMQCTQESCN